jgi:membrane protein DedA with SNARE-associated domain
VGFFHDGAALIEPYLRQYGLMALFVTLYLESFGAPLPGESALVGTSLLAAHGDFAIGKVFLAAWTAAVLGDTTGYAIGHFGGRPLLQRYGNYVKLTPARLEYLEGLFSRHGAKIVVVARFVVLLRQLNGLVAGSMGMHWLHFLAANALGAAIWAGVWCFGPYLLGDLFHFGFR